MKILLDDMNDVTCFVASNEFFDGTIDVVQKHYRVNGRSFMGMCSLDLTKPIDVTIDTDNEKIAEDYYKSLQKWSVKE